VEVEVEMSLVVLAGVEDVDNIWKFWI